MQEKTGRSPETPNIAPEAQRRWVTTTPYHQSVRYDKDDDLSIKLDMTGEFVTAFVRGVNRKKDDIILAAFCGLDIGFGPNIEPSIARMIASSHTIKAENDPACREIRTLNMLEEVIDSSFGIIYKMHQSVDRFIQVVRWDIGRHADRNTGGAVTDEIREFAGQYLGFFTGIIIVGLKIDGILFEVR